MEMQVIRWKPVMGWMAEDEYQMLGLKPQPKTTYHALWPFSRPTILQRVAGQWSMCETKVQDRALISVHLKADPSIKEQMEAHLAKAGVPDGPGLVGPFRITQSHR